MGMGSDFFLCVFVEGKDFRLFVCLGESQRKGWVFVYNEREGIGEFSLRVCGRDEDRECLCVCA